MKVKLTQTSVIRGSVWPIGSIVDLPEPQARELIGLKRAVESKETPVPLYKPAAEDQGSEKDKKK